MAPIFRQFVTTSWICYVLLVSFGMRFQRLRGITKFDSVNTNIPFDSNFTYESIFCHSDKCRSCKKTSNVKQRMLFSKIVHNRYMTHATCM